MLCFGLSIFHQTKQKKHLSLGDFYKFIKYLAGETQQQSEIEMGRAPCCDKANVKKGPWSPEEDTKLKAYIDKYGTGGNWIALPQKIGLKRCGKSCRLRWLNYLRPNIKHGGFSEEEDNIICSLYISIGSRWSIIAAQLPGRTDNDIKNYWNTRLKKKLLGKRKQSNRLSSTSQLDSKNEFDNSYSQALSNSAFERLQLHMQLQSLQSPFSIYNGPSVFPKLHPLQEKMIHQTLRCSNENPSSWMQQVLSSPQSLLDQQKAQFYEPTTTLQEQEEYPNPKMDELENSFNGISSSDSSIGFTTGSNCNLSVGHKPDSIHEHFNGGTQSASTFQAELESFLNNKSACGFVPQDQDQIAEFDCFKEVDGAKDIMLWWPSSNDIDSKSASLNSWDLASVLQSEMFQDYALGYNM